MNRLAVFVEGHTEALFIERLIENIAGAYRVQFDYRMLRGGVRAPRKYQQIRITNSGSNQDSYVLIVDCGGDDLVKTRILEEHENLTRSQYTKIIGIRDVAPRYRRADIPLLTASLQKYVKSSLIPVEFVLSVMEIEAWFLAEFTHLARIHSSITTAAVRAALGFDPELDDSSLRTAPAADLAACYRIGGHTYSKSAVDRTISALDFERIYLELPSKIPFLNALIASIDSFLP